ncbi:hypothetical protein Q9L58_010826 [Maublancomyces gigas]|uniref:Uncharacterized protein n=1 Tax=Discina gigas TaxID=1032678 RepID=A0ABR3G2Z8_9PEZI
MNEKVIGQIGHSGISVTAFQMFFFAAFAAVAMLAFGFYAKRYKMVDNYRTSGGPGKKLSALMGRPVDTIRPQRSGRIF